MSFVLEMPFLGSVWCNKIPRIGWLNQQTVLTVLEAEKSKFKVLADSVSDEGSLSGLQTAVFLLYPHLEVRGGSGLFFL